MSEVRDEFRRPDLNADGEAKTCAVAAVFSRALTEIEALIPHGPDMARVVLHMQEAARHAKRGVAAQKENQK